MVSLLNGNHGVPSLTQVEIMHSSPSSGDAIPPPAKIKTSNGIVNGSNIANIAASSIPLSARRSQPLDMTTVERKGQKQVSHSAKKKTFYSLHGLTEAPIFRPSEDEFRDPMEFIRSIASQGRKYGIIKIIPPESWNPDFAIDTERFHFRTRRQELNSVEGGTRSSLNYIDQLTKFHQQNGQNMTRFPSVDKRPLDLYKLKKAVDSRGGFDKVCKGKKWAEIGRDLGYSGKIMSSLSTSLKNSYQRWLQPYEDYLRIAKPGVQHLLELENGGPFTPSPSTSPAKMNMQEPISAYQNPHISAKNATVAIQNQLNENKAAVDIASDKKVNGINEQQKKKPTFSHFIGSAFTPVNVPSSSAFVSETNTRHLPDRPINGNESPGRFIENSRRIDHASALNSSQPQNQSRNNNGLKRKISDQQEKLHVSDADWNERKSKRIKRESVPSVAGSHMTQHRMPAVIPKPNHMKNREVDKANEEICDSCGNVDIRSSTISCDSCDGIYHKCCLEPPPQCDPDQNWHCPKCLVGTGDFGFEDGGVYSLKQFQDKARKFKEKYFRTRLSSDASTNNYTPPSEIDIEREFWRLVESISDTVEVEYGADIHTTTHGSGYPTTERNLRDPYANDLWNLNILPFHPESLFRHIKSDISGMTVPWLYVGMCFSTFCWHNEDHYTYSANYHHLGEPKKWYGIPASDALRFEDAMRKAVPELFESQPDLLFQLVTLLPPDQLKKAGVSVYTLDQRAGEFIITFPQAYHAGFNFGFNVNEAVNFAPPDWEPFGEAGMQRLQEFRRQPCFSHDELLLNAAARDSTIKTARWLAPALKRMQDRELSIRRNFISRHMDIVRHECTLENSETSECPLSVQIDETQNNEEGLICAYCKTYAYLSRFWCRSSGRITCLPHAGNYQCCGETDEKSIISGTEGRHVVQLQMTKEALSVIVEKVDERARIPETWIGKVERLLEDDPRPSLKALRSLLTEGEKIPWPLPQLPELRQFVERANEWVEEATNYITRKQQNRRKNEKAWRKGSAAKVAELEERDRELRNIENITKLLKEAEAISFDCPEISELQKRANTISEFRKDACAVLANISLRTTQELEELIELGKSYNVDIPEIERLDKMVQQAKWYDEARNQRDNVQTLEAVNFFIERGEEVGIPRSSNEMNRIREEKLQGELWEAKAREVMAVENVHYQQLEALLSQAAVLPVSPETLATVSALVKKQRDAREQIQSLYERSQSSELSQRPRYKEVRDATESLSDFNGKPPGTIDLEREQKRHEDWMRKGKKLFGKANAPLHILLSHMQIVEARNEACFDLRDQPRMPVEPSSRANSPGESQEVDGSGSSRDVFCICRKPEAGMMIECELCREWYHGKCLKIARGKVKEDDKYTCPICDYRVKIPRDAARPKLEDLQAWQDEIPTLPFQPEEEECLASIINTAQTFRQFMAAYINPMLSNPDELTTQRFYLRKIEGADILLVNETNFFKQELHKWAPIASEPPPLIQVSLSTRKPRPTKQQKLMTSLGIVNPDDLPQHLRTKPYNMTHRRSSHSQIKTSLPLQPAPTCSPVTPKSHTPTNGDANFMHPAVANNASFAFSGVSAAVSLPVDPFLASNQVYSASPSIGVGSPQVSSADASLYSNPTVPLAHGTNSESNPFSPPIANDEENNASSVMETLFTELVNPDENSPNNARDIDTDVEVDGQVLVNEFLHQDLDEKVDADK